ncbi:calcium-activated chloride channel regulator 1-like [Ruditapes philippinarum]|uniref:calcium-activated chloride channel regulator 1-like n=1 Tax=Ruditapes philippinarum TaxID=129788 RepID=UPI00295BC82C|nr:calcium-activated chloride channel regulator 1-like [Ruditapes philippinarum]
MNGTQVTMLINGIAEAGLYLLTISMSNPDQTIEYYVSSTPTKPDIIKISTQLSASKIDVSSGDVPVAFATVTKGYSQVINASVKAHIEADNKRCTLSLLDNGHDPDAFVDDGVYSGYVFPRCLDSGRVNIKVYASGQKGMTRISRKVIGAPSVIEEDEDEPEPFDESFQRVQVMEELYVTKDINDEDFTDVVAPGRITDVGIFHIVKETSVYGENRNFTISWTATGDDRNQGRASSYIMRVSDDFDALLNNFDSAAILNMTNTSLIPQEAGQTEAIKFVVDAEKSYTETTFFAIQAVDDAGNRGAVSNIVSIVVAKGYRLKAEPGTLNIKSDEIATIAENDSIAGIIGGTVGGTICGLIICVMIVLLRKRLRSKSVKNDIA